MTSSKSQKPRKRRPVRKVFVFSDLNHDLRPEDFARLIVRAGIEQARKDAIAKRGDVADGEEIEDA